MNYYRYEASIPSNVRYGHWELLPTVLSVVAVIGAVIEFISGSYWFALYSAITVTVAVQVMSLKISRLKGTLLIILTTTLFALFRQYYENQHLVIALCMIFMIVQLLVLTFGSRLYYEEYSEDQSLKQEKLP